MSLPMISAIIHKDVRIYRVLCIAVIVLQAATTAIERMLAFAGPMASNPGALVIGPWALVTIVAVFVTAVAIVLIVQQDGMRGGPEDWRTRPLTPLSLFIAKLALCLAITWAPTFLTHLLIDLIDGMPVGAALLAAPPGTTYLYYVLTCMIVAWLTTSAVQAVVAGVVLTGIGLIGSVLLVALPYAVAIPGSRLDWIWWQVFAASFVIFGGAALWLQLVSRRLNVARGSFLAFYLIGSYVAYLPTRGVLAVQNAISPAATDDVRLAIAAPLCTTPVAPSALGAFNLPAVMDGALPMPGVDLAIDGIPTDKALRIDHLEIAFLDASGATMEGGRATSPETGLQRRPDGSWRLRQSFSHPGQPASARLVYSMTLLKETGVVTSTLSRKWTAMPGGGACRAQRKENLVAISCAGGLAPPTELDVFVGGRAAACSASILGCEPAYAPALLRTLGGYGARSRIASAQGIAADAPVVFRSYAYAGHLRREITLPLGPLDKLAPCEPPKPITQNP